MNAKRARGMIPRAFPPRATGPPDGRAHSRNARLTASVHAVVRSGLLRALSAALPLDQRDRALRPRPRSTGSWCRAMPASWRHHQRCGAAVLSRSSRARMSASTLSRLSVAPRFLQFGVAALGADLRGRLHEQLGVGVGRDHRADVAPVEHRAARLRGEPPLALEQRRADQRMRGHDRGDLADLVVAQRLVGQQQHRRSRTRRPRRPRVAGSSSSRITFAATARYSSPVSRCGSL